MDFCSVSIKKPWPQGLSVVLQLCPSVQFISPLNPQLYDMFGSPPAVESLQPCWKNCTEWKHTRLQTKRTCMCENTQERNTFFFKSADLYPNISCILIVFNLLTIWLLWGLDGHKPSANGTTIKALSTKTVFVRCCETPTDSDSRNFTKQTREVTGKGESLEENIKAFARRTYNF